MNVPVLVLAALLVNHITLGCNDALGEDPNTWPEVARTGWQDSASFGEQNLTQGWKNSSSQKCFDYVVTMGIMKKAFPSYYNTYMENLDNTQKENRNTNLTNKTSDDFVNYLIDQILNDATELTNLDSDFEDNYSVSVSDIKTGLKKFLRMGTKNNYTHLKMLQGLNNISAQNIVQMLEYFGTMYNEFPYKFTKHNNNLAIYMDYDVFQEYVLGGFEKYLNIILFASIFDDSFEQFGIEDKGRSAYIYLMSFVKIIVFSKVVRLHRNTADFQSFLDIVNSISDVAEIQSYYLDQFAPNWITLFKDISGTSDVTFLERFNPTEKIRILYCVMQYKNDQEKIDFLLDLLRNANLDFDTMLDLFRDFYPHEMNGMMEIYMHLNNPAQIDKTIMLFDTIGFAKKNVLLDNLPEMKELLEKIDSITNEKLEVLNNILFAQSEDQLKFMFETTPDLTENNIEDIISLAGQLSSAQISSAMGLLEKINLTKLDQALSTLKVGLADLSYSNISAALDLLNNLTEAQIENIVSLAGNLNSAQLSSAMKLLPMINFTKIDDILELLEKDVVRSKIIEITTIILKLDENQREELFELFTIDNPLISDAVIGTAISMIAAAEDPGAKIQEYKLMLG